MRAMSNFRKMTIGFVAFALAFALIGADGPKSGESRELPVVHHKGRMHQVMMGELAGQVDLATPADLPHLYAVGPLENLNGEVTIWDGHPHLTQVNDAGVPVAVPDDEAWKKSAIFLVWAQVELWSEHPVSAPIGDMGGLRTQIERAAKEAGIDLEKSAFPVLVEGDAEALGFHVVRKESDEDFGPEQHRRAMKKFDRHDLPVRLVGFYSRMHGGVFTHRGEPLHLHAVMPSDDGSTISGHVESVSLQAGATIKLPKMSP